MKIVHHAKISSAVDEGPGAGGESIIRAITWEELMAALGKLDDVPSFRHSASVEVCPDDLEADIQITWEEEV